MKNICVNCHYSFTDGGPCKCKLNIGTDNRAIQSFMRKQQVIGYRICLADFQPDDAVLSDQEISEKIESNVAHMKLEIERIGNL